MGLGGTVADNKLGARRGRGLADHNHQTIIDNPATIQKFFDFPPGVSQLLVAPPEGLEPPFPHSHLSMRCGQTFGYLKGLWEVLQCSGTGSRTPPTQVSTW